MEGFTYNNIFETKGIEYIIVLLFFAFLIPFWILLNRQTKLKKQINDFMNILTIGALKIPQGIYFSHFHTWTFLETTGTAKIGIDDLLLHITGKVHLVPFRKPGEKIKKGDLMAEIEHSGKKLSLLSPVTGEIVEINTQVIENPELMSEDPYTKGWIYKLKPKNWSADTRSHYLAEEATQWNEAELRRCKNFIAGSVTKAAFVNANPILQDGGEMLDHPLSDLPEEVWIEFQNSFLDKNRKIPE